MENLDKQSWLQRMGLESWQPELVISGVLFWSSLSLPQYLYHVGDYASATISSKHHEVLFMMMTYVQVAMFVFIVTFGIHLVSRLMWVAMLGLNSVFPQGVVYEKIDESDYFKEKFQEDNPNIIHFTEKLDDFSSILFAMSCSAASTFISINIILVFVYTITTILISVFGIPTGEHTVVSITFGFLIAIPLFFYLIGKVLFKRNLWAQKTYYRFSQSMSYVAGFGFLPGIYTYVYYTFSTNIDKKKIMYWSVAYGFFITIFSSILIAFNVRDARSVFLRRNEQEQQSNQYITQSDFYEKLRPQSHRILWPVIPNDVIEGAYMKVFVPYFADERSQLRESCPSKDVLGDKCFTEGLRKYFTLSVNDSTYNEPFVLMKHPNANEKGFISVLPTKAFNDGQNKISIRRVVNGDTSNVVIPFWFVKP